VVHVFDAIVIGGGAAGLFCAAEAGKRGRRVAILEHSDRVGKKILISGGGRANFTNVHCRPENFLSPNPHFAKSALAAYGPADFVGLIEQHQEAIDRGHGLRARQAALASGADMIDVSSGQTTRMARPVYGRMYQTPFSDRIRNEVGIATIAVGNIFEPDHVNSIIAAGRADLCALARPHLADAFWTLHAAAELEYAHAEWPEQYLTGKAQLERNLARAAQMAIDV
jgi:hypothetical protein